MQSARVRDENGFVTIKSNPVSRAGVFQYLGESIGAPEKKRVYNVYRPAEELADPECLASFRNLPITDDHAMLGPSDEGFIPAEKKGVHGVTGEAVDFRENVLYSDIKIFSEDLQKKIKSGKVGLSLGYRCKYEATPGTFAGQSYDYVQRSLRGNHLALVDTPRNNVHVLDSQNKDFTFDHVDINDEKEPEMTVSKEAFDALEKTVKDQAKIIGKLTADAEEKAKADMEAEEKAAADKKAADEEAAKKDEGKETAADTKKTMDALDASLKVANAKIETLEKGGIKALLGEVSKRDALARDLAVHVGTFDHSEMTHDEVAKYGNEKLKLGADAGQEAAVLKGFLAAKAATKPATAVFDASDDVKKSDAAKTFAQSQN